MPGILCFLRRIYRNFENLLDLLYSLNCRTCREGGSLDYGSRLMRATLVVFTLVTPRT